MAKVYLSPSSQVSNPYAWGSTNEAAQCRRIADAAAAALTRSGLSVKNNQTAPMEGRVAESNAWGADLHVCIHTNAFNGRVTGTRVFSWNDAGRGRAAAQAVFDELAPLTPGTSDSLSTNQTWYELRRTAAPCVYVEAEFHDNAEAARWISAFGAESGTCYWGRRAIQRATASVVPGLRQKCGCTVRKCSESPGESV